ncbi:MAG: hypothetical protein D6712_10095 [Chloroflexi bacterium]|nr:MAG: hypothetical protein D6712_10095 [Chloroflexota bacterium]
MKKVILTEKERARMEREAQAEIKAQLGERPTLERLQTSKSAAHRALDAIDDYGRVITLLVAEITQSIAPVALAIVFAVLEFQRVQAGAMALGQAANNAQWIAIGVVTANFVVPIYALRARRHEVEHIETKKTLKSLFLSVWGRIVGDEEVQKVDWTYNATLKASKMLITVTTIALAIYDLLAPLIEQIATGTATRPMIILLIELAMGVGLSVAGVFFLQSASHEIGVRMLTERPENAERVLERAEKEYDARALEIREQVRARYEAAKAERMAEREADKMTEKPADFLPINGNGRR